MGRRLPQAEMDIFINNILMADEKNEEEKTLKEELEKEPEVSAMEKMIQYSLGKSNIFEKVKDDGDAEYRDSVGQDVYEIDGSKKSSDKKKDISIRSSEYTNPDSIFGGSSGRRSLEDLEDRLGRGQSEYEAEKEDMANYQKSLDRITY